MLIATLKKNSGILTLAAAVILILVLRGDNFLSGYNLINLTKRTSLYSVMGLGVVFVIVTGGIDLSIGSVVGLTGTLLAFLLAEQHWSVPAALAFTMTVAMLIGVFHGFLITKMRLQPFVVTLCGLLIYRGAARLITGDKNVGFGSDFQPLKQVVKAQWELPWITQNWGYRLPSPLILMIILAVTAALFLNRTIWGRYLLALGRNEVAAKLCGIQTDRMKFVAYLICSLAAGLTGILFALENNFVQPPSTGEFYELHAIAAAVLGGCSLRGGEGSIFGLLVGTLTLRLLENAILLLGVPDPARDSVIGVVLLVGVFGDELFRRVSESRKLRRKSG
ncbi:MAG: ABC transporter permease [Planctomyces sp.]|jgi:ribose transport system permease protein